LQLGEVLRMALLGNDERVTAETALRIGLVTEVTPPETLWERADSLAVAIASKPTAATQGTVRALWESFDMPRSSALRNALKYTQLGNAAGMAQVDRAAIMGRAKKFSRR
jgi:enoyl-CoA hydratase/carnithine racemase